MSNNKFRHAENKRRRRWSSTRLWTAICALVLIVLLILWLTIADLSGDTDVAAVIPVIRI